MTIAIMQPTFLPWIGYFDMIDTVNNFVFLDNVQLTKRSWQVRNRIKINDSEFYLNIPIKKTQSRDNTFISTTEICNTINWKNKHLNSLYHNYNKCLYFDEVYCLINKEYQNNSSSLAEFNISLIKLICYNLGINTNLFRASQLENIEGKKDELLSSICRNLNCQEYLSPVGSSVYLESENPGGKISKSGINLYYHQYSHPQYHQTGKNFISHMCVLDLLFNYGFTKSHKVIRQGRKLPLHYKNFLIH